MAWGRPDFARLPVTIRRWKGLKREKIEIHRELVTVTERGVFGEKKWTEPMATFEGVLCRMITQIGGDESGAHSLYNIHLLELIHPEQEKTVLLYQTTSYVGHIRGFGGPFEKEQRVRKMWKDASHALNLPALQQAPDDGF